MLRCRRSGDAGSGARSGRRPSLEEPMGKKILVAVAWPYASGARHLGHVAGFGVPSDVFARYQRLAGSDVLMVSGTDDHGTPITVRAEKEHKTPKELTNFYNAEI